MDTITIEGVVITPLKTMLNVKGNVFHAMKSSDPGFRGFGEAYFTTVNNGDVKGWKKHLRMTLNLVVPVGEIRFVMFDNRVGSATEGEYREVILSTSNYHRLTVPPGVWMAFKGVGEELNLLLNMANVEHDPTEVESLSLESIPFNWSEA